MNQLTTFIEGQDATRVQGKLRPWSTLQDVAAYASRCTWSPAVFQDGRRDLEVLGYDLVALDIDNGTDGALNAAVAKLYSLKCSGVVLGTRSHLKEKHGLVAERFRVIIPLSRRATKEEFVATWAALAEIFGADRQTRDLGRIYFPSPGPLSIVDRAPYRPLAPQPEAPPTPAPEVPVEELKALREAYDERALLQRAREYVAKMPPSIAGQGGHGALFAVAVKLRQGFLLAEADALPLLREYNERAEPPWTESELVRKFEEAAKVTDPRLHAGHMLVKNLPAYRALRPEVKKLPPQKFARPGRRGQPTVPELTAMLEGKVWRDTLSGQIHTDMPICNRGGLRAWTDADTRLWRLTLAQQGEDVRLTLADEIVQTVADDDYRDRLGDYIRALEGYPTPPDLAETWLIRQGVEDTPANRIISKRWGLCAVRRALEPGCRADYTLLLVGAQGMYKSTFCRSLVPTEDLFAELAGNLEHKDEQMKLRRAWIVELGELASMRKSEMDFVKAFLTRTFDEYRPPYGRLTEVFKRRCAFVATTNDAMSLVDQSGSRRFMPVDVHNYLRPLSPEERESMWAALYAAYRAGERAWPDAEEEAVLASIRAQHDPGDPLDEDLRNVIPTLGAKFQMSHVFDKLGIPSERRSIAFGARIGNRLRAQGYVRRQVGTDRIRWWFKP